MKNLIERAKPFMNTLITIKVVQNNQNTVNILDAIESGFGEFERIVKRYTRFNEDSELSNLNRQAGNWVQISDEFFELITKMLELSKKTNGAFDPTITDFLETYGYDKNYDFSKLENPELDNYVKKIAKERASWKDIELNILEKKVKLQNGQKLDLGGIGKGYAIDCAYNAISASGFDNFIIDAGGDIRAKGKNQKDKVWVAGLKHENESGEQYIHSQIELNNMALACSGSWARKVRQFHHIIDPLNGKPKNDFKTIYVLADTATKADGWSTALFVLGKNINQNIIKSEKIQFFAL